jgi:hypothetical protein
VIVPALTSIELTNSYFGSLGIATFLVEWNVERRRRGKPPDFTPIIPCFFPILLKNIVFLAKKEKFGLQGRKKTRINDAVLEI